MGACAVQQTCCIIAISTFLSLFLFLFLFSFFSSDFSSFSRHSTFSPFFWNYNRFLLASKILIITFIAPFPRFLIASFRTLSLLLDVSKLLQITRWKTNGFYLDNLVLLIFIQDCYKKNRLNWKSHCILPLLNLEISH